MSNQHVVEIKKSNDRIAKLLKKVALHDTKRIDQLEIDHEGFKNKLEYFDTVIEKEREINKKSFKRLRRHIFHSKLWDYAHKLILYGLVAAGWLPDFVKFFA